MLQSMLKLSCYIKVSPMNFQGSCSIISGIYGCKQYFHCKQRLINIKATDCSIASFVSQCHCIHRL